MAPRFSFRFFWTKATLAMHFSGQWSVVSGQCWVLGTLRLRSAVWSEAREWLLGDALRRGSLWRRLAVGRPEELSHVGGDVRGLLSAPRRGQVAVIAKPVLGRDQHGWKRRQRQAAFGGDSLEDPLVAIGLAGIAPRLGLERVHAEGHEEDLGAVAEDLVDERFQIVSEGELRVRKRGRQMRG